MRRPLASVMITTAVGALTLAACGGGGTTKATRAASTASAVAVANASSVQIGTTHTSLGTVLVAGPRRLTVYMFEADKAGTSACSGACAQLWPPVIASGEAAAEGGAIASKLSTITRSDGSRQVTYNGHPLYYFVKDTATGETHGQGVDGFGARWYVLAPSGNVIKGTGSHPHASSTAKPAAGSAPAHESPPPEEKPAPHPAHEERASEEKPAEEPAEEKPAEEQPAPHQSAPMPEGNEGIPQGSGGDHDGDNSGGPSDGDGNI